MPARKIFSALLCVLFLWVFSCFFASSCLAAVVINEFCPKPNSGEKEWIEFYNPENIDLSNWIIEEKTSTGNITQHIIRNNENLINNPIFDVFTFSSYKLNDKGDEIKLFNKKNKKVDEHSYSETERGISFARIPDGGNWSTSNPPTKGSSNGTSIPSNPSSPPSPSPSPPNLPNQPYPANIYLSEFMACPSEGNEWVEIYNDNDSSVNLSDWLIRDSTDGKNQSFSTDIGGKSYHKIDISGYLLNNSGDSVRLLSPGSEVDSHAYSECDSSYTWSKVNGSWCKTDQSPGNNNNSCKEESSQDSNSSPSPSSTAKKASAKPSAKPSSPPKTTAKPNKNTKPSSNPDQSEINLMEYADVLGEQDENKEEKEENKSLFQSKLFFPIILSLSGLLFITASLYPKIRPKILKILGKK